MKFYETVTRGRRFIFMIIKRGALWLKIIFVSCSTEKSFVPVMGHEIHSGNIEDVASKEKSKFPQDFFPEVSGQCY